MSWDIWHVYGYGTPTDPTVIEENKMLDFIKKHKTSLEQTRPDIANRLNQLFEDIAEENGEPDFDIGKAILETTYTNCYAEIIASIMTHETGITFDCTGLTDEGEEAVIFCPSYPWDNNAKEKDITINDLNTLFFKYMKELTDEPIKVDFIDYVFSG